MNKLEAPWPYFGKKTKWSDDVWSRFGTPEVYSEPFAGSAAILLQSPSIAKREVICDINGFVCNFWRSVKHDPEQAAGYADYPTIHDDLRARHRWLISWGNDNASKLTEDPEWYDPKAAGWWAWGFANWIGAGWCDGTFYDFIPRPGGDGISQQRKDINLETIMHWFGRLHERLKGVIVYNRPWGHAVTKCVLDYYPQRPKNPSIAVFLDPPYKVDGRAKNLYEGDDSNDPAVAAYMWAMKHGDTHRIAYAMQAGDFAVPDDWEELQQPFRGYGLDREKRDCIIFSPACNRQQTLF